MFYIFINLTMLGVGVGYGWHSVTTDRAPLTLERDILGMMKEDIETARAVMAREGVL